MLDQLLAHPAVTEDMRLGSPVGVMAIHGGIEAGTAEIARALARTTGASMYVVEQPAELSWHLPSTAYDPVFSPALADFVSHVRVAVSLHGFGREHIRKAVLVGGRNETLGWHLARALENVRGLNVIADPKKIPKELRGRHPRNPVNLPAEGGVQLEMSGWVRSSARGRVTEALGAAISALH